MHSHRDLFRSPSHSPPLPQQQFDLLLEEKLEEETCWRTNLMLESEVIRVDERDQLFKKRTSFEENLVNDHLLAMRRALEGTGLQVSQATLPVNDKMFQEEKERREIECLEGNTYLSEEQKWEIREVVLQNQENFSVLMRLSGVLEQNKEELVYLLAKIIHYCSVSVPSQPHQRNKPNLQQLLDSHRLKLLDALLNQPLLKLLTPAFFSADNEGALGEIIEVWFYNMLCIKNGVYEAEEMEEEREENFFD